MPTGARSDNSRIEAQSVLLSAPLIAGMVLGMALGIGPVVTVSTVGALLLALVVPYAGLAILAFMGPLVPPSVIPAPGFDSVLVGAILLGCVYRLPIDRPRLSLNAPVLLLFAFVLFVTVQQLPEMLAGYGSDADHAVGYLYWQLLSTVGAILAAGHLLRDRSPYPILAMAMPGAALVAGIALASYGATTVAQPLGNLVASSTDLGRATGSFSNPNYLGSYAAVMLVAAVGLLMSVRGRVPRVLLGADAVLLLGTVGLSLSRGGVVAALVGVAILLLVRGRALAVAVLVGGVVGAALIYPMFVQWRLETVLGSASTQAYALLSQSDNGRLTGLVTAPALFLSSPIDGIGFGHFVPASVNVPGTLAPINAHNWYLTVLAEQGLIGVILIALAAIALVARLWRRPPAPRALGFGVLGALATMSLFLEPPTSFQMIVTPVIILVAAVAADWRREHSAGLASDPLSTGGDNSPEEVH
jgi:O-antigen ligase